MFFYFCMLQKPGLLCCLHHSAFFLLPVLTLLVNSLVFSQPRVCLWLPRIFVAKEESYLNSSQTMIVVVLSHTVDYPSWRSKDNTALLFMLAFLNHVWKMCIYCTRVGGEGSSHHRFSEWVFWSYSELSYLDVNIKCLDSSVYLVVTF